MKERSTFNETFSEDVTSLHFNQNVPTMLLASSLDGMVTVFDLTQNNEEDATVFGRRTIGEFL
jgi:WD40 repeat protein